MSNELKFRRGSTASHAVFTGAQAEVTYDTDKKTLVVHDNVTPGGFALAKAEDLAANGGAGLVVTIAPGVGAVARTLEAIARDRISIKGFGADCGGVVDDTVNIQKALDALTDGQELVFLGTPRISGTLYCSNKNHVKLNFDACELKVAHSSGCSLLVHGGVLTRNAAIWPTEMIESVYATTVPCAGVIVSNLKVSGASAGRKAAQVIAYFADDCTIDARVSNSNGSGVEFRHCVRPKFSKISVDDFANYGLFVYQCYGLDGGTFSAKNGGRAFEIKQRHRLYQSLDHNIATVKCVDLQGLSAADPAWTTGGVSYNEMVRADLSAEAQANRNFAGHEISRNVTFGSLDFSVTAGAVAGVTSPSTHIGGFADAWTINSLSFDAGGKGTDVTALAIGSRGDITEGKAGGATFGENHKITNVKFVNYQNTTAAGMIRYGVSCSIVGGSYKNCAVVKLLMPGASAAELPFSTVGSVEFRNHAGDVNLLMGPLAERGVLTGTETLKFISGGNQLKFTPMAFNAENACNPWYVKSAVWQTFGRDEIEIPVNLSGAPLHTTTYAAITIATAGNVKMKITATAPTTLNGLGVLSAASTKALTLEPCELVLTGAPSGGKVAISTAGEVNNIGGHVFSGTWSTTLSDTSGKNSQNLRRTVYLTAAPTTGTWVTGDRAINITPFVGQPKSWVCTFGATPGTWVSEGNL